MGKGAEEQEETEMENASAEIAVKQWTDVKQRYLPLERTLKDKTLNKDLNRSNEEAAIASRGGTAFANSRSSGMKSVAARGINPNSGAASDVVANIGDDQGEAMGLGQTNADQGRETRTIQSATNLVATGREVEGQTMNAYGNVGRIQSQRDQITESAKAAEQRAYGQAAGQAVGLGVGSYLGSRGPAGVSDAQLVASGGSIGARNASVHLGQGMVP
jgi:hypothetical protein